MLMKRDSLQLEDATAQQVGQTWWVNASTIVPKSSMALASQLGMNGGTLSYCRVGFGFPYNARP